MKLRHIPWSIAAFAALLAVAACGDDEDESDGSSPTATPSATAAASGTATATGESPGVSATPTPSPTPAPTSTLFPGARRAIIPVDIVGILQDTFPSVVPDPLICQWDPERGLIDCTAHNLGLIQPDPRPPDGVTECRALPKDGQPAIVSCVGPTPDHFRLYAVEVQA